MKRKNPQIEVDAFNAIMGVGDPIDYWEILGEGDPKRYTTRAPAEVLSGHTAVVWVNEKSGCLSISHCLPANPNAK